MNSFESELSMKVPEGIVKLRAFSPFPGAAQAAADYIRDLHNSRRDVLALLESVMTTVASADDIHPRRKANLMLRIAEAKAEWIQKYGA